MNRTMGALALVALIAGIAFTTGSVAADAGGDFGSCVVGVESPCNGPEAGDGTVGHHPDAAVREPSDGFPLAPDSPVARPSDGLPLAPNGSDVVEPVPEPQLPSPQFGPADGVGGGECIGNATVMCGPTDLADPDDVVVYDASAASGENGIQCVRAPCERPSSNAAEVAHPTRESGHHGSATRVADIFERVYGLLAGFGW